MTIRIALVGFCNIAREHRPAISTDQRYCLSAFITRGGDPRTGVLYFEDVAAMLAARPRELDAIALCALPAVRYSISCEAIAAGLGVLLEKPTRVTLGEIHEIERLARTADTPLYTAWRSRHAPGFAKAALALAGREISSVQIAWLEDVRKWHSGQQWIWQAGGFGVFDLGIDALSIVSQILPCPLLIDKARRWRATGGEQWSIGVTTSSGTKVDLQRGGERLSIHGEPQVLPMRRGYPSIYNHSSAKQRDRLVDVDSEPLCIAADAFPCGHRETVGAFVE